ncbi:uncharacterized protein JN550_000805 [Neoarthrinium moseri]|uniref:uncharacterized protein n=1 Tax=Neoarthrinium moseri TaxID=1658444 RepID=UPI001FDE81E3|nr:uncharacterized protein JN550_000805 [Neoarthrinium moseri]KAI1876733.1 hypothetical protein JN550_000805 [Neoarthrinium moseri]
MINVDGPSADQNQSEFLLCDLSDKKEVAANRYCHPDRNISVPRTGGSVEPESQVAQQNYSSKKVDRATGDMDLNQVHSDDLCSGASNYSNNSATLHSGDAFLIPRTGIEVTKQHHNHIMHGSHTSNISGANLISASVIPTLQKPIDNVSFFTQSATNPYKNHIARRDDDADDESLFVPSQRSTPKPPQSDYHKLKYEKVPDTATDKQVPHLATSVKSGAASRIPPGNDDQLHNVCTEFYNDRSDESQLRHPTSGHAVPSSTGRTQREPQLLDQPMEDAASSTISCESLREALKDLKHQKAILEDDAIMHPNDADIKQNILDIDVLIEEITVQVREAMLSQRSQSADQTHKYSQAEKRKRSDDMKMGSKKQKVDIQGQKAPDDDMKMKSRVQIKDHHDFWQEYSKKQKSDINKIYRILAREPKNYPRISQQKETLEEVDSQTVFGTQQKPEPNAALSRLMSYSDPMQARIIQSDHPDMRDIKATNKKEQLKQQRKNVPEGCDMNKFWDDRRLLENAIDTFGYKKCKPSNGMWRLEGIITPLHDYQILGDSWMIIKELSRDRGGILADQMGLGKTIQCLATAMVNRPITKQSQDRPKATLIVVPATIRQQWMQAIEDHVDSNVMKGCLPYKSGIGMNVDALECMAFVIATYDDIRASYYPSNILKKIELGDYTDEEKDTLKKTHLGPLHRMRFHRVILDEAHNIKGDKTQGASACGALMSTYRWCVTGTPLINDPIDVVNDFVDRTNELLQKHEENGTTPPKELNHAHLTLCLRLRQAATHLFLLEPVIKRIMRREDIERIQAELQAINEKTLLCKQIESSIPTAMDEATFGASKYDHAFDVSSGMELALLWHSEGVCKGCLTELKNAQIYSCGHKLCGSCVGIMIVKASQLRCAKPRCIECNQELEGGRPDVTKIDEDEDGLSVDDESDYGSSNGNEYTSAHAEEDADYRRFKEVQATVNSSRTKSPKGKDGKPLNFQPRGEAFMTSLLTECDKRYSANNPVIPSSKIGKAIEVVKCWQRESPSDKIIIFQQFLGGIGGLSAAKRDKAIEAFKNSSKIKVMVASLKCGGVGLNLTCANRVILVEPWFNHHMELQAFARVFRLGQMKPCYFVNLIATGTLDEKIFEKQNKKLKDIEECFGAAFRGKGKLRLGDVMGLLGTTSNDVDNNAAQNA